MSISQVLDTERKCYFGSVCRRHTDDQFPGLRVRWHQLWSIRLHILCLLHGKLSSHQIKRNTMSRFSPETLHDNETQCTYLQVAVASVSIPCLVYLSAHNGFIGIWIALTIYMSLRTIASTWRYDTTALSS